MGSVTGGDRLILVNEADEVVGHETKERCHDGEGILHRAFSVFLFNGRGEVLLQERSAEKRLWPGFWSNSCCSHPREGEAIGQAAVRRVKEELGIDATLRYVYKFQYHAEFGAAGSERELCSVFVGNSDAAVKVDPAEISAVRWIAPAALTREIAAKPAEFTPWFKMEWERLTGEFAGVMKGFGER